jgi:hypothetical protein
MTRNKKFFIPKMVMMMIGDEVYGIVYGGNQWEGEGKGNETKG